MILREIRQWVERKEGRKEGEKINPKKERKYTGEIFLGKGAREQRQEWVS